MLLLSLQPQKLRLKIQQWLPYIIQHLFDIGKVIFIDVSCAVGAACLHLSLSAQCFLSVLKHNRCAVCFILRLQDSSEHYDKYALLNIYRKKAGIVKHIREVSGAILIFLPYA